MGTTIIFINLLALSCLIFAFVKDRARTKPSMLIAVKSSFSGPVPYRVAEGG